MTLAEEVIDSSGDPVYAEDLQNELSTIRDQLFQLSSKVEQRNLVLQNIFDQCGQFETDSDNFLRWLTKTERTMSNLRPISADADTVKEQSANFQVSYVILFCYIIVRHTFCAIIK